MIILVFLVHAIFAAIFPIGRAASLIVAPIFFTAVRMLIGGSVLLSYSWVRYGNIIPRIKNILWIIIAFSISGIYLTNSMEFWGLQYLPSAKASFIYSLSPFVAAILSYFLFKEKMTIKKLIGMAIGFLGFIIMIIHHEPGESTAYSFGYFSLPEVALTIAAIASAAGWIFLRRNIRNQKSVILIEVLGFSMLIGSLFCFAQSLVTEPWNPIPLYDYPHTFGLFALYMTMALLVSNLIAYPLYTELLKTYTATFLSFSGFIQPLCAAFYGWLFLGEIVTVYFFLASILVFIGLFIFYKEDLRQGYVLKK
jgi:drug/metabolite transporter (DMT)-like permease